MLFRSLPVMLPAAIVVADGVPEARFSLSMVAARVFSGAWRVSTDKNDLELAIANVEGKTVAQVTQERDDRLAKSKLIALDAAAVNTA